MNTKTNIQPGVTASTREQPQPLVNMLNYPFAYEPDFHTSSLTWRSTTEAWTEAVIESIGYEDVAHLVSEADEFWDDVDLLGEVS